MMTLEKEIESLKQYIKAGKVTEYDPYFVDYCINKYIKPNTSKHFRPVMIEMFKNEVKSLFNK